jgi:hypothetical protein
MGAHCVKLLSPYIEAMLLLLAVAGRLTLHFCTKIPMHSFMTAIVAGACKRDTIWHHAKLYPPGT